MDLSVVYDEINHCLVGKYVGVFEPKHVKIYVREALKLARKHKCKRFLNDMREADIKLSITELYYAAGETILGEFDRSWKRAIVVKEKNQAMEFLEITSSNKGLIVRIFDDYDEALVWL